MRDPVDAFFRGLDGRDDDAVLRHTEGSVRFDLESGDATAHWFVSIHDGLVTVAQRDHQADCVVAVDRELFTRIVTGQTNALAAMLRGAIHLVGNPRLVIALERFMPGPSDAQHGRATAAPGDGGARTSGQRARR